MSFYDWYCDLPPSSPQTWGEQTDVPESADWYNSGFLILWGSNVPQTRTPGRAFLHRGALPGRQVACVICPDYSEAAKFSDIWLSPEAGHRRRAGDGDGPRDPARVPPRPAGASISTTTPAATPTCRCWCGSTTADGRLVPDRYAARRRLRRRARPDEQSRLEDRRLRRASGESCVPNGSIGFRWGEDGQVEPRGEGRRRGRRRRCGCRCSSEHRDDVVGGRLPLFRRHRRTRTSSKRDHPDVLTRNVPVQRIDARQDGEALVATVFDLFCANYGSTAGSAANVRDAELRRRHSLYAGLGREDHRREARRRSSPWRASSRATPRRPTASRWSSSAPAINHWYHMDMNYRGIINMLVMCGCVGQSGGGWATMSARRSCARRPAGRRSPSRSTGRGRRGR